MMIEKMLHKGFFAFLCLSYFNVCLSKAPKNKLEIKKHECPYPVLKQNGSEMGIDVVGFLSGIAEIKFNGAFGKTEDKRYCKIKCINGEWVGPLCLVEGGTDSSGEGRFHPVFRSCSTKIFQSKFILSYENRTVLNVRDFPHDAVVRVRCKRFGVFKLIGDARLTCHNGVWKHRIPTCIPTSYLTNFTDDSAPPSVAAKVTSGSASVEPTGELAVYPGSTVHLECFYLRSSGEPEWSWTSTYRTYATGWSIDSEERNWKYRLSIYYVKPQDTGIYTCSTPKGSTHSIVLNVIEVHCDVAKVLTNDPNLLTQIQGSRLGQSTSYRCREGFKLNGTSSVTCQASGVWSGYAPGCVPIVCPPLNVENATVKLVKQDFGYGGTAIFTCLSGQKMIGVATLVCLVDGRWSGNIPACKDVFCPPPITSENLKIEQENVSRKSPFRAGSQLVFSCRGHHKIVGTNIIKCRDSGVWSNPPPFCKALCPHPGDPSHGRFAPRKSDYEVGDRISLVCSAGHEPTTKIRPKCQKSGSWTELGVKCAPKITFKLVERKKAQTRAEAEEAGATSPAAATTTTTTTPTFAEPATAVDQSENTFTTTTATVNATLRDKNETETDIFYVVEEQPI